MKIDLHNYEEFLLDYMDGIISEDNKSALLDFLNEHPDLQLDLEELSYIPLVPEISVLPNKDTLKKYLFDGVIPNEHNLEDFCIASHEGLLKEKEQIQLQKYLATHKQAEICFQEYAKMYVKPDLSVSYPLKRKLHHTSKSVIFQRFLTIAASVTLLIACYLTYFNKLKVSPVNQGQKMAILPMNKVLDIPEIQHPIQLVQKQSISISKFHPQNTMALLETILKQNSTPAFLKEPERSALPVWHDFKDKSPEFEPQVIVVENIQIRNQHKHSHNSNLISVISSAFRKPTLPDISGKELLAGTLKKLYDVSPLKFKVRSDTTGNISSYCLQAGKWKYEAYRQPDNQNNF